MCVDENLIFIGCADGIVRCFRAGKLDFIATLPLPHHLGVHVSNRIEVIKYKIQSRQIYYS